MIADCILISVCIVLVVLGADQLLRRKKRRKRTAQEKQSLIFGVACVPAYVLMSFLGVLLAIAAPDIQTQFGGFLYEAAVMTGRFVWLVSLVAIAMGIVYRKNDNPQASKLVQLAAMGYIAIFSILCLAAGIL